MEKTDVSNGIIKKYIFHAISITNYTFTSFLFIYRKTHFKCSHVILILDSHESGGEGEETEVNLMRD